MNVNSLLLLSCLIICSGCNDHGKDPDIDGPVQVIEDPFAFPGAEGFGQNATGGRGGKVIFVTNLNDAGVGSLRAAILASGPRYVIFKVSGTIQLKSKLTIVNDNITIAGQTAPGDGICIRDYPVVVAADNVIIRFIRFRLGDETDQQADALEGRFIGNIIIDHCSMSWSTDECVTFYANENTTVQWCLISESLKNSVHEKGSHGYGGIWGGKNASFHHNLLAHHDSRNPRLGEEAGKGFALTDKVDIRNNVIYNWGSNGMYGGEAMNANVVNCYFKPGPATTAINSVTKQGRIYSIDKNKVTGTEVYDTWGKFYIDGNVVEGLPDPTGDNWTHGVFNQFHSSYSSYTSPCVDANGNTITCQYSIPVTDQNKSAMKLSALHDIGNNVTTHSALTSYERVLDHAGASLFRDAVDSRIITNVRNATYQFEGSNGSTNGIIDSQSDVGGWPVLTSLESPVDSDEDGMPDAWEIEMKLDPDKANSNENELSSAYDNIEVYINSLVKNIVEAQVKN